MTDRETTTAGDEPTTKVGRLIEKYELEGVGKELERRWTAPAGERDSLRTLADDFNVRILGRAMEEAKTEPLEGEIENAYRLLTDEDVSRGVRTEVETRLNQRGVDVDAVRAEFVTYQAIRTFLKDVRGASYEADEADGVERAESHFARLVGRTTAVVEQTLDQLRSTGRLTLGAFRVRTVVTVYCEDCETQYEVSALLGRGGCDCDLAEE